MSAAVPTPGDELTEAERRSLDRAIPPGRPVIRERVHAAVEAILRDRAPVATTVTDEEGGGQDG